METGLLANLAILVLAGFVGFAVISKVPNTLHTPLMSGTNAIHGIVLLGGLIVLGHAENPSLVDQIILVVAITFGMINVVGGFLVTDRMLAMFKSKPEPPAADKVSADGKVEG
ncbi:NAD(P) transhydrogenase subunit alpha [Pseudonocardia bannensis]|uniref:proton-translocating NAD(P)(+) transhydrogenase n=1 Tax=Pseudonocardia bannensis TaxID=630973 RepID=A0A848DI08_9PSEU|nr:NAD(P) transhydrogenase subunit alpha [Pseudonocardia bannensis]NMH92312.1 NAD(P) transhydrogenase subunit alpha [Pseudonocardia bannensis]